MGSNFSGQKPGIIERIALYTKCQFTSAAAAESAAAAAPGLADAAAAGASAAAAVVAAGHNSRRHSADLPAVAAGHSSLHMPADRTAGFRSLGPVAHTALAALAADGAAVAAAGVGGTENVSLYLAFHLKFGKVVRQKDFEGNYVTKRVPLSVSHYEEVMK